MGKRHGANKVFYYAAGLSALAVLVIAAFFAPQVVFQAQDAIRCRGAVLVSEREKMGVEALNTSYEKSLPRRMDNFAEGLAGGRKFYVTEQEMEPTDYIIDYLHFDSGPCSEVIFAFCTGGIIPYDFWDTSVSLRQWKQYVIYSDDYARGVNFILWYLEVEAETGTVLRLLTDAEDGTVYALQTDGSRYAADEKSVYGQELGINTELWYYLALRYMALDEALLRQERQGIGIEFVDVDSTGGGYRYSGEVVVGERAISYDVQQPGRVEFHLFYGTASLDMVFETDAADVQDKAAASTETDEVPKLDKKIDTKLYQDVTIGFEEIYRMIPEFA